MRGSLVFDDGSLRGESGLSGVRIFAFGCFAIAMLSGFASSGASPVMAEELVKFDAARLVRQTKAPRDRGGADLLQSGHEIQGYLSKPNGGGPFPALVVLHSCLGLPENRRSMASAFASWGYVVLFVDDFATRGIKETCAVDFGRGLPDAFGALRYLSRLPGVDPARIGTVGYSQGADTALAIASSRFDAAFAIPKGLKFKAAAAFYPPCANQATASPQIPTLILIGELDDVTPLADCAKLARKRPGEPADVKLVAYPGAYHGFDNPSFADGTRLYGMWLKYDRSAEERSSGELRNFLPPSLLARPRPHLLR